MCETKFKGASSEEINGAGRWTEIHEGDSLLENRSTRVSMERGTLNGCDYDDHELIHSFLRLNGHRHQTDIAGM